MTAEQKIIVALWAALVAFLLGWFGGLFTGRKLYKTEPAEPTIIERIDTVTVTEVRIDTIYKVREKVSYLERVDTLTNTIIDTVAVVVPLSKYVAEQDSLYRVEATGYDVTFDSITVYPKTVTITNTVETKKPTRLGIGLQAGYGVTVDGRVVKMSPYVGVGLSYNILTF